MAEALAGILTFSDKLIDEAYKRQIKEEMQMTQIGQMLIDEGMEKGIQALIEDNREDGVSDEESSKSCRNVFPWTEGKRNRIWSVLHRSRMDR